jgi:hypothetical protein
VLAIEPRGFGTGQKELGFIRVRATIGHGEDAGAAVLQGKVLVHELSPVDGLSCRNIMIICYIAVMALSYYCFSILYGACTFNY